MNYDDYMKSVEWEEKRQLRLRLDGFRCFKCGTSVNLQVHHITYERLGQERMGDLITLCGSCHKRLHEPKRQSRSEKDLFLETVKRLGVDGSAIDLFTCYLMLYERIKKDELLTLKGCDVNERLESNRAAIERIKEALKEVDPEIMEVIE